MNIVIIGGGTVGAAICAELSADKHDITIIDGDPNAVEKITSTSDVFGVVGNGADISVLRKAGAEKADLVIAVTSGDELNILCCAAAKKLGAQNTVARVRNPEYSELMALMKSEMNLSLTINPELAAAKEIYRALRFPAAAKVDTFYRGRVEMAEFVVSESSPLCGVTLNELRSKLNLRFLVCGVLRGEEAVIPNGLFRLNAGDVICVTAPDEELSRFFLAAGEKKRPVKDVLIAGGGRVSYYLEALLQKAHIKSTVIEKDRALCDDIAQEYASATVVCGDATHQELLLEEGLERTDAFLALLDTDEENAIISMYAKTKGVRKVVTLIRTMSYIDFFRGVGLQSIVSPRSSTASFILRYVRSLANAGSSHIETLHKVLFDRVAAIEFRVKENIQGLTDVPLKALKCKKGILIACIGRKDKVIIPTGDDVINNGDTVIVVTAKHHPEGLEDILES
ncbi:MAG: Trk system potassium transporter TrkA [Clostridia bacterium]|nr:Trk system potassium transporter TrkA [Clostridia bacterium]